MAASNRKTLLTIFKKHEILNIYIYRGGFSIIWGGVMSGGLGVMEYPQGDGVRGPSPRNFFFHILKRIFIPFRI